MEAWKTAEASSPQSRGNSCWVTRLGEEKAEGGERSPGGLTALLLDGPLDSHCSGERILLHMPPWPAVLLTLLGSSSHV